MNLWNTAAAAGEAALDVAFGERTHILRPAAGSAYVASGAPPQVLRADLVGVIDEGTDVSPLDGDIGARRAFRGQVRAGEVVVSYRQVLFASEAEWPQRGDLIQAIERTGAPVFEVAAGPEPDDGGRLNCQVIRRKAP